MTVVDLVRHAQSVMNLDRSVVGGRSNDTPLSVEGERAALVLGCRLAESGYRPDAVYCTSAVRSRQTAELLRHANPWWPPILVEDGLLELSQGAAEGGAREQWWTVDELSRMHADPLHHRLAPDAESHAQVQQRMRDILHMIAARHPGQTVLAVGHGIAIRTLVWSLTGGNHHDGFTSQHLDNLGHIRILVDPATHAIRLKGPAAERQPDRQSHLRPV